MHGTSRNIVAAILTVLIVLPAAGTLIYGESKTLAATLNVMAFPKAGQNASQQSEDESACYDWAVQNAGVDPFDLQKKSDEAGKQAQQAQQQAKDVGKGAGAKGAVGGAAAGALIGAIAGDTGEGAAIGAAAGVIAGRRRGRAARAEAEKQAEKQEEQAKGGIEEQKKNFLNAFSVCLEAKNYMVKY